MAPATDGAESPPWRRFAAQITTLISSPLEPLENITKSTAPICIGQVSCGGKGEEACADSNLIKLVVNSPYTSEERVGKPESVPSVPREVLFASLAEAGFRDWPNVVLVEGGATHEEQPVLLPLRSVMSSCDAAWCQSGNVTVVRTMLMSFDLHGYSALHRYRAHPLVRSTAYFYMLESTVAEPTFCERLDSFANLGPKLYTQLHTTPPPSSNMNIFGAKLVHEYGDNFDWPLTKHQGLFIEFGLPVRTDKECGTPGVPWAFTANEDDTEPCPRLPGVCASTEPGASVEDDVQEPTDEEWGCLPRVTQPLLHFALQLGNESGHFWPKRVDFGPIRADLYQEGATRARFVYPDFGVSKLIKWGGTGQEKRETARFERVIDGTTLVPLSLHCARSDFAARFGPAHRQQLEEYKRHFVEVQSPLTSVGDILGRPRGIPQANPLVKHEEMPHVSDECAGVATVVPLPDASEASQAKAAVLRERPLIVNLGLPKTGTSSFHQMMGAIGAPSYHVGGNGALGWYNEGVEGDPPDGTTLSEAEVAAVRASCKANGTVSGRVNSRHGEPDYDRIAKAIQQTTLECFLNTSGYMALDDDPWPYLYEQVDRIVPHARFVLWDRNEDEWADSFLKFFSIADNFWDEIGSGFLTPALGVCNASEVNRAKLLDVYRGHRARVKDYFLGPNAPAERRQRFLMLDINDHDATWKLCDFAFGIKRTDCAKYVNATSQKVSTGDILATAQSDQATSALAAAQWPLGKANDISAVRACKTAALTREQERMSRTGMDVIASFFDKAGLGSFFHKKQKRGLAAL